MIQFSKAQILFSFFFLFLLATLSSAQKKVSTVTYPENGVDVFPVYKATQANCQIDSIVYTARFIVFCVSFDVSTAEGKYHFEPVNSNKSWMVYNERGYRKPLLIRNIRCNGALVAASVKDKALDVSLEAGTGRTTTRISCQFQCWRVPFELDGVKILKDLKQTTEPNDKEVLFEEIRLRKTNYHHGVSSALAASYEMDYLWSREEDVKRIDVLVNEELIAHDWKRSASSNRSEQRYPFPYKVDQKHKGRLFLETIEQQGVTTIFKVLFYIEGDYEGIISLYHAKRRGFTLHQGKKKIRMKTIKNIQVNGAVIRAELKEKETIVVRNIRKPCLITFDIYFDNLPDDLTNVDLIETFGGDGFPFNLYDVQLTPN